MNFDLTEERQMLQDSLRRFLRDRYSTEVRNQILESEAGFSAEIWGELAELGVVGALFTEEQGGFGGAGFDIAVVFEELGRAGVVEPFMETLLVGRLLAAAGRDVSAAIEGAAQYALAHAEPDARYDFAHVSATVSDGKITGRKAVVLNAEAAQSLIVSAKDGDTVGLYLVDAGASGLEIVGYPLLAGGRAGEVTLEQTPAEPLGLGLESLEEVQGLAIVAQCAETLGAMETAATLTREYMTTRQQFGRPIATFQVLQHRLADMLIEMDQARSAVINAAGHLEDDTRMREMSLSAAKNLLGRVGRLVAEEAIQMHGGIAMTQEYELAHIAKRIVMADHRFGDTDFHLERYIALSAA
jgi:alkylation response protein AidB-like acyl-CoA dehydrogenase